jgi:hypothetical protein
MSTKVEHILARRIALRDKISGMKADYDRSVEPLKLAADDCDAWLLQRAIEAGVDQFKCKGVGTAYKSITTRVSCADWPEFHAWVLKTKNVSALEQRVSKTFVKEYRGANKDTLPPGVTIFEEAVMNVRRSPQPKGDSE